MNGSEDMFQANPPGVAAALSRASVFIAGAGGLGSNVAMLLTRGGVGRIAVADFDRVTISNLNRQWYFRRQIGQMKVEALRDSLLDVNPGLRLETFPVRLERSNFAEVIPAGVDIIFECFDNPAAKADLTRFVLTRRRNIFYIAVSGLGGTGPLEKLSVRKLTPEFFLIGDGVTDVADGIGTLSSRVMAAAAAQAHCGIRLLMEKYGAGNDL